jgi:hypothetical protein
LNSYRYNCKGKNTIDKKHGDVKTYLEDVGRRKNANQPGQVATEEMAEEANRAKHETRLI